MTAIRPRLTWRTSSYSTDNGQCVEIAADAGGWLVRDSKHRSTPAQHYTHASWAAFLATLGDRR